jgi:hypothetical protein
MVFVRATPARLAVALRLAKLLLEEDLGHRWTQEDEDWYISVIRDYSHVTILKSKIQYE